MIIDGTIVTNPQSPAPIGLVLDGVTHWITVAGAADLARLLRQIAETVHGDPPAPAHEPDPAAYGAVLAALRARQTRRATPAGPAGAAAAHQ